MPIILCNSNPRDLAEFFIDAVEGLALQSTAQMKLKFVEVETATKVSWPELWRLSVYAAAATNSFLSSLILVSKMITKRKILEHNFSKRKKINWLRSKNILNVIAR